METNHYKITGDKSGLIATKQFDNDIIEITMTFSFGNWDNDSGSCDIETEIVSSMYHEIDSEHPIVLNDEMQLELSEDVFEYVNDDLERFGYNCYDDDNYVAHDTATEINYNRNE